MEERCTYCGKLLNYGSGIPAYDLLHETTKDKVCCSRCNKLITVTNKSIATYMQTRNDDNIKEAISNLKKFIDKKH